MPKHHVDNIDCASPLASGFLSLPEPNLMKFDDNEYAMVTEEARYHRRRISVWSGICLLVLQITLVPYMSVVSVWARHLDSADLIAMASTRG
jgi:hypothetical protein